MFRQVLALIFVLFLSAQAKFYAVDKDMQVKEIPSSVADFVKNDPNVNAFVEFRDDREATGWVYYYYKASSANPDWLQQYLAGYMEGYSAYYLMWDSWNNAQIWFGDVNDDVINFMHSQLDWIEAMIENNPQDNYWLAVNSTLAQMHGLYDGYQTGISAARLYDKNLTFDQFYQLTYLADLFDVMSKFTDGKSIKPLSCSFLARIFEDNLFVSHTTWFGFTSLLRAYRVLDLSLQNPLVKTKRISYSGLPGALPSQDDFYILDNARVVTETSLGSYNTDVYSYIHSNTVPYWIRITVANLLFETQQDWVDIFFAYRSGTYNNQWMIIDFNNFNASVGNLAAAKNIIWMVEEFYGYTSVQDVTQELLIPQGYVASYNVPYSPVIQNVSQNPTNYTTDPRAILFKKYAPGIQNIDDFRTVMRMNNFSDTGDYCQAIASRCDLSSNNEFPSGAIDCKVTSNTLSTTHQAWIQSGPTHETLPPFTWDNWPQYNQSRAGMPDVYDFDWVYMDPNTNYSTTAYEHGKLAMDGGSAFIMESNWRHQVGVSIAI